MKRFFLSCCFFLAALLAKGQDGFPQAFVGHWSGTLHWYGSDQKEPQKVPMQLIVKPTDTAHVYTWQIRYGEGSEDNRPYLMKAIDTLKGHWLLDEQNGIRINQYWLGNRLTSTFRVMGATIVYSYRREGESLIAESYSMKTDKATQSGNGTKESPRVESFQVSGFQRAVLTKEPSRTEPGGL